MTKKLGNQSPTLVLGPEEVYERARKEKEERGIGSRELGKRKKKKKGKKEKKEKNRAKRKKKKKKRKKKIGKMKKLI